MTDEFTKAYNKAVRYLARRARSILEMRRYLSGKQTGHDTVEAVISRLLQDNYLNDRDFAEQFVESRCRFKPKSRYALGYELLAKGIDEQIVNEVTSDLNDFDMARKVAAAKMPQINHLPLETREKKLLNHLRYRGFDYGTCKAVWEHFK